MKSRDPLWIGSAPAEELEASLQLALRSISPEQRSRQVDSALADWRSGRIEGGTLLEGRRGDRRVAAVHWQLQPGRTAVLWPPGVVPGEPTATADHLFEAALQELARQPVRIAQVLLEQVSQSDAALLASHGFAFLADLLYLVSLPVEFPRKCPSGPLKFDEYSEGNHPRLASLVEATYQGTRDCPGLDHVRDIEDVLAGYRASGVFQPAHWLVARCGSDDVGCLLLSDYPDQGNMELVYMGLVPSARGKGWGRHLVRHAQWLTAEAGRPRLVLAVDAANEPAIEVYTGCGFQAWDRRTAFLKVFETGS